MLDDGQAGWRVAGGVDATGDLGTGVQRVCSVRRWFSRIERCESKYSQHSVFTLYLLRTVFSARLLYLRHDLCAGWIDGYDSTGGRAIGDADYSHSRRQLLPVFSGEPQS